MVHTCAIFKCHNRSNTDSIKRGYFGIPVIRIHEGEQTELFSKQRRELWLTRIGRKDYTPSKHTKICSDHFVSGRPSALYDRTNPDWAPSLKLYGSDESSETERDLKRYERAQKRKETKKTHETAEALLQLSKSFFETEGEAEVKSECQFLKLGHLQGDELQPQNKEIQTDEDSEICDKLRQECQRLTSENFDIRKKLSDSKLSEASFEGNDKKVNYYTGLPNFLTLMALFQFLEPYIHESKFLDVTKFQKLLLVLMKLRLNLSTQDLGYRFNISPSSVSRIFLSVVNVMYIRMKDFIYWPDRDEIRLAMPMEFRKHFGLKCSVIIDCFEIFIERPSGLLARAKTWSSYKHHNTVKYLIGITPQGTTSFISKGWGGRASDKHITENCGLLDKLLPGDLVLADRGFDISESVGMMCAEVKIPSFTKGKSQLSALDIEQTRTIAHVRIHVERVIGLVRNKFTILQCTIPIDYLISGPGEVPAIDKIVTVCCALANMCESVVPFN